MTEAVTNEIIYSVLQRMQGDMAELKSDMRDIRTRVSSIEEHVGNTIISISGTNTRLDHLADRVERIERCLDLTEQH